MTIKEAGIEDYHSNTQIEKAYNSGYNLSTIPKYLLTEDVLLFSIST